MDHVSLEKRRAAVKHALASAALDGFTPTPEYLALLDRYINGEITNSQLGDISRASVLRGIGQKVQDDL